MKITVVVSLALLVTAGPAPFTPAAKAQRPVTPPLVTSSLDGREIFQFYCASCHGAGGKGDGPVVSSLKTLPPDLTALAVRNGGMFPTDALQQFVAGDNRPVAAHGSKDMPVWGPIFRTIAPRDPLASVRIANVVAFIGSLQKP
ncbi:MAG: cytochrome c [Acidobacteriota bacterium]